jgi:rhodanese-related sulfurtransferase
MEMSSELATPATASNLTEISREELRNRLRDTSLTVVDVLPVESYAMEHIPGAINLPYESIASRARELLPNPLAEIVVYCAKFT